jgi:hypothetical protein
MELPIREDTVQKCIGYSTHHKPIQIIQVVQLSYAIRGDNRCINSGHEARKTRNKADNPLQQLAK